MVTPAHPWASVMVPPALYCMVPVHSALRAPIPRCPLTNFVVQTVLLAHSALRQPPLQCLHMDNAVRSSLLGHSALRAVACGGGGGVGREKEGISREWDMSHVRQVPQFNHVYALCIHYIHIYIYTHINTYKCRTWNVHH